MTLIILCALTAAVGFAAGCGIGWLFDKDAMPDCFLPTINLPL